MYLWSFCTCTCRQMRDISLVDIYPVIIYYLELFQCRQEAYSYLNQTIFVWKKVHPHILANLGQNRREMLFIIQTTIVLPCELITQAILKYKLCVFLLGTSGTVEVPYSHCYSLTQTSALIVCFCYIDIGRHSMGTFVPHRRR